MTEHELYDRLLSIQNMVKYQYSVCKPLETLIDLLIEVQESNMKTDKEASNATSQHTTND